MSAPAPPAPSRLTTDDGLGIADLVALLGIDTDPAPGTDQPDGSSVGGAPTRRPLDAVAVAVAVVRGWVRRAADWGSGPQRSWCAW